MAGISIINTLNQMLNPKDKRSTGGILVPQPQKNVDTSGIPPTNNGIGNLANTFNEISAIKNQQAQQEMQRNYDFRNKEAVRDNTFQKQMQDSQLANQQRMQAEQLASQRQVTQMELANRTGLANIEGSNQRALTGMQLAGQEKLSTLEIGSRKELQESQLASQERLQAAELAARRADKGLDKDMAMTELGVRERMENNKGIRDVQMLEANNRGQFERQQAGLAIQERMENNKGVRDVQMLEANLRNQQSMQGNQIASSERMQASSLSNARIMQTEREGGQTNRLGMQIDAQDRGRREGFEHQKGMVTLQDSLKQQEKQGDRQAAAAAFRGNMAGQSANGRRFIGR